MTGQERNIILAFLGGSMGLILLVAIAKKNKREPLPDTAPFDSPDLPGSGRCMDSEFLRKLQDLESKTGYPVFENINSGARSPSHNEKVGGVSNSSHLIPICKAADIHTPNRTIQRMLVFAAKAVGFKRIGVGSTFIHLDIDSRKTQYVAWGYPKGTAEPYGVFRG